MEHFRCLVAILRGYLHETGTNSDRHEFVSAIHFCVSNGTGLKMNSDRSDLLSYFRTGLSSYRSHVNGNESQTGCGSNMFFLLVSSYLLFLSNDSITIADNIVYIDNISKQDVESSIN